MLLREAAILAAAPLVLVIAADLDLRHALSEGLGAAAFRVEMASSLADALYAIARTASSLVLLDLDLIPPEDLTGMLLVPSEDWRAPVILLGADERHLAAQARGLGVAAYLVKLFPPNALATLGA